MRIWIVSTQPRKPAALKKLADQLSALDSQAGSILPMESDMLSLIVSGTLNGEDLAQRYPAFYRKLLENAELRGAFLDALESIEAERTGQQESMPGAFQTNLDFLKDLPASPVIETFDKRSWRATWGRTLEQLQSIFSPPEMAYRADPSLSEDPWFTLLREEMTTQGVTYDVILDCTLSDKQEESLSTFLNLAVTLGSPSELYRISITRQPAMGRVPAKCPHLGRRARPISRRSACRGLRSGGSQLKAGFQTHTRDRILNYCDGQRYPMDAYLKLANDLYEGQVTESDLPSATSHTSLTQ